MTDVNPLGEFISGRDDVDIDAQADAYAAGPGEVPEDHVWWHVVDTGRAEWAMSRLRAAHGRMQEARRQRNEWTDKIDQWFLAETKRDRRRYDWLYQELATYALTVRALTLDETKTVRLPSGSIATKETKPRVALLDVDTFVSRVGLDEDIIEVVYSPKVEKLRKRYKAVHTDGPYTHRIVVTPDRHDVAPYNVLLNPDPETGLPITGSRWETGIGGTVTFIEKLDVPYGGWVVVDTLTGHVVEDAGLTVDEGGVSATVKPDPFE